MGFECVERTHVGLRRKLNEDSLVSLPERGIWAVADGMGGHEAGEVASAKVIESLARLPSTNDPDDLANSAVTALHAVNDELVELGEAGIEHRTIGSTVVGLVICGGKYRCFWAGDSRAYRVRKGSIEQITRDHSLVQGLLDAGVIEAAEAENHPNANVVTRAVGAAAALNVDVIGGDAMPGDIFLLASDGVTREVSQVELLAQIYSKPMVQAADSLVEMVLSRGAPDNLTLVIVRVE
jgi:serine/threonine protein phosphatase PrpC